MRQIGQSQYSQISPDDASLLRSLQNGHGVEGEQEEEIAELESESGHGGVENGGRGGGGGDGVLGGEEERGVGEGCDAA